MTWTREQYRIYQKAYHIAHREKRNISSRTYAAAHRKENLERSRAWHTAHREEINIRMRKYYAAHREEKRVYWRKYYSTHREEWNARTRAHSAANRFIILAHYGGKCTCCGEVTPEFLSIDHINGGGSKHRHDPKVGSGKKFYVWIIKNNFPEDLQLLCFNCNQAKGIHGTCPHQRMNKDL